jgi:hypothetical protein
MYRANVKRRFRRILQIKGRGVIMNAESNTIVIPELEDAVKCYTPYKYAWSKEDTLVLERYYGWVPLQRLIEYFHRSGPSIHKKARELGLE